MATIIIDEKTEAGKILMATAKALKKTNSTVQVFSDETSEDFLLGKIMEEEETGDYVSEEEITKILRK
jgi:hypothetical protein